MRASKQSSEVLYGVLTTFALATTEAAHEAAMAVLWENCLSNNPEVIPDVQ